MPPFGRIATAFAFFVVCSHHLISQNSFAPRDLFYAGQAGQSQTQNKSGAAKLGVRYVLLKQQSDGQFLGVAPSQPFHSGDRVRIRFEANRDVYLYIAQRGSSGSWSLLFPQPSSAPGENFFRAFQPLEVPSSPSPGFTFDNRPGEEQMFLIASNSTVPAQKLVDDLNRQQDLEAANRQDDLHERDLHFESVNEDKPGVFEGVATYVATESPADLPLLIRLRLRHEAKGEK